MEARRVTEISFIVELLLAYFHKEPAWIGEEGIICRNIRWHRYDEILFSAAAGNIKEAPFLFNLFNVVQGFG